MKKIFLLLTIVFIVLIFFSCNNIKNETTKEHKGHNHNDEKEHPIEYACQLGCEESKTYNAMGKCPVCKMDLVELEHTVEDVRHHPTDKNSKPDNNKHNQTNTEIDQEY